MSILLIPRTELRRVFAPFRSRALFAYAHVLPSWTHPYFDFLKSVEEQSGTYLRLRATTAVTALSSAIFVRLLLGLLVPANAMMLILFSALAFIGIIYLERSNLRPSLQKTLSLIQLKLSRPLNRALALEVISGNRLRDSTLNTLESLIITPGNVVNISVDYLLPFVGDLIAAIIMVIIFLLLTGGSYFPVLTLYLVYFFAELLLVYSKENFSPTDSQKLSRAVITSFRRHPADYLSTGLMKVVANHISEFKLFQASNKLQRKLSVSREKLGGDIANDVVILLMLLILFGGASISPDEAGQFLAGLLILFRLTGAVRSAIRHYFKAKAAVMQGRSHADICTRALTHYNNLNKSNFRRYGVLTRPMGRVEIEINRGVIDLRCQAIPGSRAQLRSVDLHLVGPGCVGVTGESGSGKTTLLRTLSGIYELQRGTVQLNSQNIKQFSYAEVSRSVLFLGRESLLLPEDIRNVLGSRLSGFEDDQDFIAASRQETSEHYLDSVASWQQILLQWVLRQERKVICIDQPECWPVSARQYLSNNRLDELGQNNLVVLASRDLSLLKGCKSIYLMQAGLLKKIPHSLESSHRA